MDVHKMLEQVKAGQLDIAEAEEKLKDLPYEDLGYAKLDHHRKLRSGFGETIFCQGKPDPYLKEIFLKFYERCYFCGVVFYAFYPWKVINYRYLHNNTI